ncbi:MAG: LexA repressor, partial [Gammaproteobacteria bacterium]|nr:LexA repressor [Gammaproteobacteria bacterium]
MPRTKSSKLTKRQREVLMMIRDWTTEAGFPPTRRDIAEHFDFKSPN